jgi:DivIVA domain-containing protein
MPFSPHEIENKEFIVTFRGYDREEVRSFLRAVAADYRAALELGKPYERAELESHGPGPRGLVPARDETRRRAGLVGRGVEADAFRIREAAEHDAHRIIKDAEREADEAIRAAERLTGERLEEVTLRTEELRTLEERMRRRLYFLETALELARRDLGFDASTPQGLDDESGELPISAKQYLPSGPPERS